MDQARPLDPALLQVIRSSAGRLAQFRDAFVQLLHADLVTMVPDPGGDGWALCERMVQVVLWAATSEAPPEVIADGLRWLGAANRLEGFPEAQYVSVAHALVRAVHVLSENHWSASLGSAWIGYFLWIEPYLLLGAEQAAQQQAAELAAQLQVTEPPAAAGEVDLEAAGSLLEDEDEDDHAGYGQIMVSMTRSPRRPSR